VKNGAETDVDCGGGACQGCKTGKVCGGNGDCKSGICTNGACAAPTTCTNGAQDGTETDTDCGGLCAKCALNKHCLEDFDCLSNNCPGGNICLP
jgi:hypothetical protein